MCRGTSPREVPGTKSPTGFPGRHHTSLSRLTGATESRGATAGGAQELVSSVGVTSPRAFPLLICSDASAVKNS